ncbi:hypothetical protein DFH29DRAFT_1005444 [Suillus ampliporus]|nr:hypothetical protein DFH29DRAFT_1005444 [Suillus ampliporus]
MKLSPSIKKKNSVGTDKDVSVIPPPSDTLGEINAGADDEDTEEEIEALIQDAETACVNLPAGSEQVKVVSGLLLKVRGFIVKVRRSPQAKKYFKKCCENALDQELELLPYCKTRWGSWNGVIARMLLLKKAVKTFINTADDSDDVPNVDKHQQKYASYRVSETEWDLLAMILKVLAAAANVQEAFSAEYYPTVWRILPLYKDFITQWQNFLKTPRWLCFDMLSRQFNKYCQKHTTEIATGKDPIPTPELGSSSNGFGSLMSRVTEGRHARKKLVTKDFCAELKLYIEEPLIINDEQASPEHQAEHIFEWWKVNAM